MTTRKIRVASLSCLAALSGFAMAGALLAPSVGAQQSGGATADQTSTASGNATAINGSVASGDSFAENGSVASGCSTAINDSTASGGNCRPAAPPAVKVTPAPPAQAKAVQPTFTG